MKAKLFIPALAVAATMTVSVSCNKAGIGGDATLVVYLKHHGNVIVNHVTHLDTVFVKFNADELPGTSPSNFDTYFVGEADEDHIHCKGLKTGKYYIYGAGLDSTGPYRVTGGMAVKIKHSNKTGDTNIDLAVTE